MPYLVELLVLEAQDLHGGLPHLANLLFRENLRGSEGVVLQGQLLPHLGAEVGAGCDIKAQ